MSRLNPVKMMEADPVMAGEVKRLRAMSMPELLVEYQRLWGKAPRVKHRDYLWKRCAWKIQEARCGGLSAVAKARLEELIAMLGIDFGERTVAGVRTKPEKAAMPDSLTREWRGRRITVRRVEGGYEYDGQIYKSLSAIAKEVTGAHWNGRHFFGLTKRKERA